MAPASLRVGSFIIDSERNCLRLGNRRFALEPLVMDVLCHLASRAGDVVSRDELISHIWFFNPGADESLTRAVSQLRKVFKEDPGGGPYIETIWKRGYAFVAKVERLERKRAAATLSGVPGEDAFQEFSVAVLPFRNMSVAAEDAFLADGITRDLTMLLSRVPRLRVAAYSSAITMDEGSEPVTSIANRLGVRYVVCGSLARHGEQFQLRAALMDGVDDAQVWAQRIDARLDQFYSVQDRIVLDVSTSTASALMISHSAVLQGRRPFQLGAYELVQRAESLRLNYNRETAQEIVRLLDRALAIDPDDAAVHSALAVQLTQNVTSKFDGTPVESFALAKRHVETAIALAPEDPDVLAAAGVAATMMGNARLAVRKLRRAVELDPNNPHSLAVLGWQHCWLHGDPAGREMIETAEGRAPHHPRYSVWAHYRGHCELRLGNLSGAIRAYRDGAERNPGYSLNLVTLAAAQALDGDMREARSTVARIRKIAPDYSPDDFACLVRRMVYWFGECPTGDDMIAALEKAWGREAA